MNSIQQPVELQHPTGGRIRRVLVSVVTADVGDPTVQVMAAPPGSAMAPVSDVIAVDSDHVEVDVDIAIERGWAVSVEAVNLTADVQLIFDR